MPDTGLVPTQEPNEGTSLSDIRARLRLAAEMLERSAYELAAVRGCPDVTHLILTAETVERIIKRLNRPVQQD